MTNRSTIVLSAAALVCTVLPMHAAIDLIAKGSLSGSLFDLSGQSAPLENGVAGDILGGLGSGLAWAGGDTFLGLPDRGPNATPWNSNVDDTSSYIPRFQTLNLALTSTPGGSLPYAVTPTLTGTTLLYSTTGLNYAPATAANNFIAGAPSLNTATKNYFTGRSDNFAAGLSTNPANGRLDPEGIRMSPDGKYVYISDEYGPYLYQFDRATGERTRAYALPSNLAATNLSSQGATEISGNTVGRIANKGMEGLAISPDGKTLFGFMQSPLEQDSVGTPGLGKINRIVTVDVASGATQQFAYNNTVTVGTKTYNNNSSEILALNSHQFLVLNRDGKGLGDGTNAAFKQLRLVDLAGAVDVSGLSGESALLPYAKTSTLFLDLVSNLNSHGITSANIPAKLEGAAFGRDVIVNGTLTHTLWIANDNDFLSTVGSLTNPNQWFVFGFTDADLAAKGITEFYAIPEPSTYAAVLAGLTIAVVGFRRFARKA